MEGILRARTLPDPPIPWIWGGDGRYMYNLNAQDQTVSVIDGSTDTVISTITLTAGKDFASIFYRSLYHEVHVAGLNWVAIIDGDPDSGTFNTIIFSGAAPNYNLGYVSGAYLPFPIDNLLIGGSTVDIVGPHPNNNQSIVTSDRRYSGGAGHGHSLIQNQYLTPSGYLYSFDFVFKLKRRNSNGLIPTTFFNGSSTQYYLERALNKAPYHDLLGQNFPVIQFGNFCWVVSGTNLYMLAQESAQSNIFIFKNSFLTSFQRAFQEYCPNSPNRLFWTDQNGVTKIFVCLMSYDNKDMTLEGTIDRAAYKDTNEQGANVMMYNPYNGRMYVQANNNNQQNTGVGLVHVYDPTQAVASMYIKSIAVGQMKSASRVSVTGLNTFCMNRTRLYEYPNIRL